jgi:diguanylate cyclase (GGDEF)-like protein
MTAAAELLQDPHRLAALYRLELLDEPRATDWAHLVRSAAAAARAPMAAVVLVDADGTQALATQGLSAEPQSATGAIAASLLTAEQLTVISDPAAFAADGWLAKANVKWAAGQALHSRDGHAIGAFLVLDTAARGADAATEGLVSDLAALAEALIAKRDLEQTSDMLQASLNGLREALHDQATIDPDTRLWSRKGLVAILPQELARAQREGKVVSIVLAELDHAAMIRQQHGHAAVQHALKEAASRIRTAVRPYDLIGRFGPSQFLVALIGGDADSAQRTAERIRKGVSSKPVPFYDDELSLGLTIGLAVGTDVPMDAAETLVGAAASALAQAKSGSGEKLVSTTV